jgi:hypothetical protein
VGSAIKETIVASHAVWVGDYQRAFGLYMQVLDSQRDLDTLTAYKVNFELVVVSTIIGKHEIAQTFIARLEDRFDHVDQVAKEIETKSERSIEKMQSSIIGQFIRTKKFNHEKIRDVVESFSGEKDILALFISPQHSRNTLRSAVRHAKKMQIPEVFEEGIFRFTLSSDLYRVVGKAYSARELHLERLRDLMNLKVLADNLNMFYVENEDLRIIAGMQRDGLVVCHYLREHPRDTQGPEKIHVFFRNVSKALSEPEGNQ